MLSVKDQKSLVWRALGLIGTVVLSACSGGVDPASLSRPVNRPPAVESANSPQISVYQFHAFEHDATQGGRTFSDPDGDVLTYQLLLNLASDSPPSFSSEPMSGLRIEGTRILGVPKDPVILEARIFARDPSGLRAQDGFRIVVLPNNAPHVAQPNEDLLAAVGEYVELDTTQFGKTFEELDGDSMSYTVQIRGGPWDLQVDGTRISGTLDSVGLAEVAITAEDGYGGSATDVFLIAAPAPEPGPPTLPDSPYSYADEELDLPPDFRPLPGSQVAPFNDASPVDNRTSNAGALLGRVLFYDRRLSITNTVSCGSCHVQGHGFAEPARFSVGALGVPLKRHTMALTNVRYNLQRFWFSDMRAGSLKQLVLEPLQNPEELGTPLPLLEQKIREASFYPPLFEAAFGTPEINAERIAAALAQFLQSLISYRAPIDSVLHPFDEDPWMTTWNVSLMTPQQHRGFRIFSGDAGIDCQSCHDLHTHINFWQANTGLDVEVTDPGILHNGRNRGASGVFRTSSLRNIAVSAPYMHDGRFATLREVIDHYDHGIQFTKNLDFHLEFGPDKAKSMNLSSEDKDALESFLLMLTDEALLTDPKFSDPFE